MGAKNSKRDKKATPKSGKGARKKALLVHQRFQPFVRSDYRILESEYDTEEYLYRLDGWPWKVVQWWKLFCKARNADLLFSWFMDDYSVLAAFIGKWLGKKTIVVTGGADACDFPEIEYGHLGKRSARWKARFTIKHSSKVLMFSRFSKEHFEEKIPLETEYMHLGIDTERFTPEGKKEKLAITVGDVTSWNLRRKGLETFVRAAALLPDVPFVLIGKFLDDSHKDLEKISSANVKIIGRIDDCELLSYYRRAAVYVQVSYEEGFGVSNAEAMSCECVPVVTRCGSLPEITGECGIYVKENNPEETARGIEKALDSPELGRKARERIVENFRQEIRQKELLEMLRKL